MKKSLHLLTITAISSTIAFIALIAFGLVSLSLFLASLAIWFALITVHAYAPEKRAAWLPRTSRKGVGLSASACNADLPYAA